MKGATREQEEKFATDFVSIHAPVKGATLLAGLIPAKEEGFNPRTREGCDPDSTIPVPFAVSFNPRTREGCDDTPG